MQDNISKITINETIDGRPVGEVEPKPRKTEKKVKRRGADKYIWGIYFGIVVTSLIELYSASSTEVRGTNIYGPLMRHAIFLLAGMGIAYWFQNIKYFYFRKFAVITAILTFALVIYSSFFGVTINGAQRAIAIAGMTIQPAEIAKLSLVLLLTAILAKYQESGGVSTKGCIISAIVVVLFCGIIWKNGLTNMVILMAVSVIMFIVSGMQWRKLLCIMIVYGTFGVIAYKVLYSNKDKETVEVSEEVGRQSTHESRFERYMRGVHPGDTINDENRQEMMAHFAQAHGGLKGNGPGNSRESVRLPLAFSDYIYAIIVEDTGLIGGVALMLLYLLLIARAGKIVSQCNRAFPALLIMGCAILIVFQALTHMAIVTGTFPVSGQPLPFYSKGGTSILVMSAAIGMMLSVSKSAAITKDEVSDETSALPEEMQSANPMKYYGKNK